MSSENPNIKLRPEEYLEKKQVKKLLEKMIVAMLDKRPENIEIFMVQWLMPKIPQGISISDPQNAYINLGLPQISESPSSPIVETTQKPEEPIAKVPSKSSFPTRSFPSRNQSSPLASPSGKIAFPSSPSAFSTTNPSSSQTITKPSVSFSPTVNLDEKPKRISQSQIRRKSEINPALMHKAVHGSGRKPILPLFSTNTAVEIIEVPKEKETFDKLVNVFRNMGLFSFLNDEQRHLIVASMSLKSFVASTVIIKQGDQPDYFYIFETGVCSVMKTIDNVETFICKIEAGGYAGELGVISERPRAATIIADTDVTAWAMDKKTYWGVLRQSNMKKRETFTEILSHVDLLKILDKHQMMLVLDAVHPVEYPEGTEIIKQGDEGESFYMIIEGECGVSKPLSGSDEEIAVIKEGGYFGERALLLNEQRAATVTAKTFCKLARLDRHTFTRLLKPVIPQLLERIQSFDK